MALAALVTILPLASVAHANTIRSYVSSAGSDSNTGANCPVGNPCRSFAGALTITQPGGEIVALDGAGYGVVTINQSVTIVGTDVSSITVPAGGTGVTISGAGNVVILRNLQIIGGGAANTTGIQVNSGKLILQSSSLRLLTTGLSVSNTIADVADTNFLNNTTGIATTGTGTDTNCVGTVVFSNATTRVRVSGGNSTDNGTAYFMHDPGLGANNCFNKFTIFVNNPNNVYSINQTGNTAVVAGDGSSCTFQQGFCTSVSTYSSSAGGQGQ
jgi:hypothetical protein